MWKSALWRLLPTACFVLAVGLQTLGPRPIGVSDNNDFPKVLGRMGVWVAPEFERDQHNFFVTQYRVNEKLLWDSRIPTTELWLARIAKLICQVVMPPGRFDLRVLGIVHGLIATFAVYLCFGAFVQWPSYWRVLFTALFAIVFSDVEYVQFFSTAYMDAASMVFLMLLFAAALNVVLLHSQASWQWAALFGLAGALFLGSKLQHQPCLIPLVVFCIAVVFKTPRLTDRVAWAAAAFLLIAASCFMMAKTPADYRVESAFSVVFTKLLPRSEDPEATLRELGLPASDIAFKNTHAFSAGSPLAEPVYRARFLRDIGSYKLLTYYLGHPKTTLAVLRSDFLAFAPDIPVGNFGTMRRADSPTPVYRAEGLKLWSTVRSQLCLRLPWHIPLFYLLASGYSIFALFSLPRANNGLIWWLILAVAMMGILSFLVGSLGDATETTRHILLYQEATDMLILLTGAAIFRYRRC